MIKRRYLTYCALFIALLSAPCAKADTILPLTLTPISAIASPTGEADADDQIELQKQTDHFSLYYFEVDTPVVDAIARTLEDNYENVTSTLQVELSSKIQVKIYPDLESFHQAIYQPNAPDWLVGIADYYQNTVKIVSPNNPGPEHSYESIIQVAVHEFVHMAAGQINRNVPAYLSEGLAVYMAGQSTGVEDTITSAFKDARFPSMMKLYSVSGEEGLYQYGYAFVEYIVVEYGYEGLLELYKTPNIQTAFHISDEDFHENWMNYLKSAYSVEA